MPYYQQPAAQPQCTTDVGFRVPTRLPQPIPQPVMDKRACPILAPVAIIAANDLPRGKIARQKSSGIPAVKFCVSIAETALSGIAAGSQPRS